MNVVNLSLALIPLILLGWLAVILTRKTLYQRFPFFVVYVVYAIVAGLIRTALTGGDLRIYFYTFWGTEIFYALLGLIATYEAFREIARPLNHIRWFRPLIYLLALAAIGVSTARTIQNPPLQADKVGALILAFEIGVRYIQGGGFALAILLVTFFRLPARRYPMGIVDGFGVMAIGILAASLLRSDFGTRFNNLFSFLPAVVYIFACLIWLMALRREENQKGSSSPKPPIPLEDMLGELRRSRENAGKISKHSWK